MSRIYPVANLMTNKLLKSEELKNEIFSYLQNLSYVVSIEALNFNQLFLMRFANDKEDLCEFITFTVEGQYLVYSMSKLIQYGKIL